MTKLGKVLVVGIVLADQDNLAVTISAELSSSCDWCVEQRWALVGNSRSLCSQLNVAWESSERAPKFDILNQILGREALGSHEYLLITDDDIDLPDSFLDRYLNRVRKHDFALAQPARTHDSYIDHHFVEQLDGISARESRFVEIGPVLSIRRDAVPLLIPFDTASPMGWGYDFTWPVAMKSAGLRMGIVDAVPVRHRLRKPVAHYRHTEADLQMKNYLAQHAHLKKEEAFRIVESFC